MFEDVLLAAASRGGTSYQRNGLVSLGGDVNGVEPLVVRRVDVGSFGHQIVEDLLTMAAEGR